MSKTAYTVSLTRRADEDLDRFPRHEKEIIQQLAELSEEPKAGKKLSGGLSGAWSMALSMSVSGQHRAAYVLNEDDKECLVFLIGTRENFYDEALRRAESLKNQDRFR